MAPRKACLYIASDIIGLQNKAFQNVVSEEFPMKSLMYPYIDLKQELLKYNFDLSTRDINSPEESELIICLDNPHLLQVPKKPGQTWCLIIYDPPVYARESWDPAYHDRFDYVYTFDKTRVDNRKYFHYYFAIDTEYFPVPDIINEELYHKRLLATFVSNSIHKLEDKKNPGSLIHRRYETIKWFGNHHPDDFGFYGGTFKKRDYYFAFKGISIFKKLLPRRVYSALAARIQRKMIRVYKGELGPLDKFKVIKDYNFYYCFENTNDINGYLTEKIFDCLYSSVVPVYWGAPNISELIPYKCYIDGNDFKDLQSLYACIKKMTYQEYLKYLEEARRFLNSKDMEKFTVRNFVSCMINPLMEMLTAKSMADV